ncbi:uncharacterized protein AKAW2_10800S [Aspergillus luchuensis]|uniref:Similar to An02g09340 n=1 Tax=Aspergillus kawachii TaxID=1069201 RepID=A0A146FBY4_ASPKA|nr:uncharacterized protein AKAW2_10800S [Aspergillus luchuensis]BCR93754.1 hypothetical protein AKAW2_10800S [Aspergillus luchuensis]BCS06381.1 hypothetical protein ALUC_10763S [Aspergillus luchuensis]GAA84595.1 similar to An02g09340 [Aspergillus luchuensis IFO 4308]GAT23694.1 similar to An02g09340 [Aspergillus luchuensis]
MTQTSLLNTSWTLHRLSPLHHGRDFDSLVNNPAALKFYATRLRDQLTAASFPIALQSTGPLPTTDDDTLSRTGALQSCTWEPITSLSFSDIEHERDPDNESQASNGPRSRARTQRSAPALHTPSQEGSGILVKLEYENATYKAALLSLSSLPAIQTETATPKPRTRTRSQTQTHATHLPLLLTRFPAPLRQTFVSFLSSTFDTYCSPLRLPSRFIGTALNTCINTLTSEDGSGSITAVEIVKELHLTLSFPAFAAPDLRTLNITVPRESLSGFLGAGNNGDGSESDVLAVLSAYLEEHLAMKFDLTGRKTEPTLKGQDHVRLARIACGGFVLGGDGKLKLVASTPAGDNGDSGAIAGRNNHLALRACEVLLSDILRRAEMNEDENKKP